MADTTLGWRFVNPRMAERHYPYSMGETAENVAERSGSAESGRIAFALESQRRRSRRIDDGRFAEQIVPIDDPARKGDAVVVDRDEHPRADSTLEALAKLKPAFRPEGGTVTAGNSSGINDGASAVLLVGGRIAPGRSASSRWPASSRPRSPASIPAVMGVGPVPASRKALERAGMTRR